MNASNARQGFVRWPWFVLGALAIVFVSAVALTGLNVWMALGICIVVFVANGAYSSLADEFIAGLSKPGMTHNPRVVGATGWLLRAVGLLCAIMIAVFLSLWAFG